MCDTCVDASGCPSQVIGAVRARGMLRAGADLHARLYPTAPSPFCLAQQLAEKGAAQVGSAAYLPG